MRTAKLITILVAAAGLSACAAQSLSSHGDWYAARAASPPAGNRVFVCHGYGCRYTTPVSFSEAELAKITTPLQVEFANPGQERAALATSVQIYEEIVGRRVGTSSDRGQTQLGGGEKDQMDCIDEATNTTSLLLLLQARGALRHHTVMHPVARGFFLDGRYPHATAVLAEIEGTEKWAIDSWPDDNGRPPVVQRLDKWLASRRTTV
ncbi:MAG: hypothetical protein OEL78_07770 [Hyphomicrobiales bacterium]|nr:hypothetical protein [Hyphomicrobiales bacterium]